MATKLEKPVSREIEMTDEFGHKGEVILTITGSGVELRKKRSSRKLFMNFKDLGKQMKLPHNAPSRYVQNPVGWLVQD